MAKKEEVQKTAEQPQIDPKVMIDGLVQKAKVALDEYMKLDQAQIDAITKAAALAGLSAQMELAKMAVEESSKTRLQRIFSQQNISGMQSSMRRQLVLSMTMLMKATSKLVSLLVSLPVLHLLQTQHLQQCSSLSAV